MTISHDDQMRQARLSRLIVPGSHRAAPPEALAPAVARARALSARKTRVDQIARAARAQGGIVGLHRLSRSLRNLEGRSK